MGTGALDFQSSSMSGDLFFSLCQDSFHWKIVDNVCKCGIISICQIRSSAYHLLRRRFRFVSLKICWPAIFKEICKLNKLNIFWAVKVQQFLCWCVTAIIILAVSITHISEQMMPYERKCPDRAINIHILGLIQSSEPCFTLFVCVCVCSAEREVYE